MNTFVHMDGLSLIEKDGKRLEAFIKPEFTFEYDSIQFHEQSKGYVLDDQWNTFTPAQEQELTTYIAANDEDPVIGPQIRTNIEAQTYLYDTDWYVIRKFETGTAIPQEVLIKRQEARELILKV